MKEQARRTLKENVEVERTHMEHAKKACPRQKPMENECGQLPILQPELRDTLSFTCI